MSDPTNRDGQAGDAEGTQPQQSAEDASTSVSDHDAHQPLVEDAPTQQMPTQGNAPAPASEPVEEADDWQRSWDEAGGGSIEPTVIAPSALRGPSHDAEAERSTLEQAPDEPVEHSSDVAPGDAATADALASTRASETRDGAGAGDAHGTAGAAAAAGVASGAASASAPSSPPELVEPRRPTLSLRGEHRPDLEDTAPFVGLAGAPDPTEPTPSTHVEEPAPTEAMPAQTALMPERQGEPQFEVDEPTPAPPTEQRTERLGSIAVDDETARAAATGTPIVLVETPTPPRKKGARGVGFLVVLLSTIIFAALLAGVLLAVEYLFDTGFVLADALQAVALTPAWILPVAVFFVGYWLTTIIVNRAGWWAHVLGGFIVAFLVYVAHSVGVFLADQRNPWNFGELFELGGVDMLRVLVPTWTILAFVIAREVPIWFGGIVSRRGRRVKERNRVAMEEYEAEQARRIEEYETSRA